ncbi:MAG: hypothetical protein ACXV5U_13175 [Ilumatobacteraceae bacterium]
MHSTTSRPAFIDLAKPGNARSERRRRADIALVAALVVPLLALGGLVLAGVPIAIAVCVQFVLVFAVTTALDIRWMLRHRRPTRPRVQGR